LYGTNHLLVQEPPVVGPEVTAEEVQESASWATSYSTVVQGSSPRVESQSIPEGVTEPIPTPSGDVPVVTQEETPEHVTTEPAAEEPAPQVTSSAEVCGEVCVSLLFCADCLIGTRHSGTGDYG
jgi:hypothetical protein